MNRSEAKQILELYRPDGLDAKERDIAAALELARRDSELEEWLEQQKRFQSAMRRKFRSIQAPIGLKERVLAQTKIVNLPWWQDQGWLRVAAIFVLFVGLGLVLPGIWKKARIPDQFADYEFRMVRSALREYRMDIESPDLNKVRQLIATKGAPSDFTLPKGLSQLSLTGGGVLRWRDNPVAMVCFNRGDNEMLFLFVMDRSAVKDPPPSTPEPGKVNKLKTLRWSEGGKTYLLAGPEEKDFARKYL